MSLDNLYNSILVQAYAFRIWSGAPPQVSSLCSSSTGVGEHVSAGHFDSSLVTVSEKKDTVLCAFSNPVFLPFWSFQTVFEVRVRQVQTPAELNDTTKWLKIPVN